MDMNHVSKETLRADVSLPLTFVITTVVPPVQQYSKVDLH